MTRLERRRGLGLLLVVVGGVRPSEVRGAQPGQAEIKLQVGI
jgi:hypothetical protein